MKIVVIQAPQYDYLAATLIEGLQVLGHRVWCSEASNYGTRLPDDDLVREAETADLIFCCSNLGVRVGLLAAVANPRRCFVDGGDLQAFEVPDGLRFKVIFKRELGRRWPGAAEAAVFPLPFAAEQRYFGEPRRKDLAVSFLANMQTNPLRHSIHRRLVNLGHPAIVSGSTDERAYSSIHPRANAIETPRYRELLARSLISVSVPGAGYDCARFWEILAAGALLFTQELDIQIPEPFEDGVSCVTFGSLAEFEDKLRHYLARPEACVRIAARGHEHLLRFHTSRARAEYCLRIALQQVERPGHCVLPVEPALCGPVT